MVVFRYIDLHDTAGDFGADVDIVDGTQAACGRNGLAQFAVLHGGGFDRLRPVLLFRLVVPVAAKAARRHHQ